MEFLSQKKEIVPKNGWDILKLINFISYIPNHFTSEIKKTTIHGFHFNLIIYEHSTIIFKILVSKTLERQIVYLKRYCQWIKKDDANKFYVKKAPISLEKPSAHPLLVFGHYFGRKNRSPSPIIQAYFSGLFTKSIESRNNPESFDNMIKSLPGRIKIIEQEKTNNGFELCNGRVLQKLIWICPWLKFRINFTHFTHTAGPPCLRHFSLIIKRISI